MEAARKELEVALGRPPQDIEVANHMGITMEEFEKIAADPRHTRVKKLIVEPITARSFGGWAMGYSAVTAEELAEVPGLSDFFNAGRSLAKITPGRAKTLLEAFRDGRWRSALR